jgi:CheY-like chemotaxis protein
MSSDNPPSEIPHKPEQPEKKILIVDDWYNNRYFLETLLKGNGYQVVSVKNGQEALEMLKSEKFDAIISDILMPVMDGYLLCRTIKEDSVLSQILFIFYTASYTESRHREYGLSLGADEYICKPIEPENFIAIIKRML